MLCAGGLSLGDRAHAESLYGPVYFLHDGIYRTAYLSPDGAYRQCRGGEGYGYLVEQAGAGFKVLPRLLCWRREGQMLLIRIDNAGHGVSTYLVPCKVAQQACSSKQGG